MKKQTVALCAILKDEIKNLPRFLESFHGAVDEIHFTDTGSTDGSIEFLEKLSKANYQGTPVYLHHFEWIDDFAAARNYSMSHTQADYIFWADLDDALENKAAFNLWRDKAMPLSDYWMATYHYGADNAGNPVCSFARERVFKRDRGFKWNYFIHEGVTPVSPYFSDIKMNYAQTWAIKHVRTNEEMVGDRGRNLKMLEKRKDKLDARMKFYFGKEYFDCGKFVESIHWLMESAADAKLEPHDRILALQYATYAYMSCNQFEQAIQIAHQGLQLDSNRAEYWVAIGDSYIKLNQLMKGIPAFHAAKGCFYNAAGTGQAAGMIFSNEACYTTYPREQLARFYAQTGQFDKAIVEAEEALMMKSPVAQTLLDEIKKVKNLSGVKPASDLKWSDDIIITAPPGTNMYEWDWDIAKERGIGGSETAAVQMAHHLHKSTGRDVKVFNDRQTSKTCEGVEYVPSSKLHEYTNKYLPKLHISWRHTIPITEAPTAIWSHDLITPGIDRLAPNMELICLSPFHKDYAMAMQGVKPEKIWVSRNGIDPARFQGKNIAKQNGKVIFPSSPDRGLNLAMQIMDKVVETLPYAELHVFYGTDNMRKMGMVAQADKLESEMRARPYVKYHGNMQQDKLAEHFLSSDVWLYPATFIETFCITALEAMAASCYPVATKIGALENTVGQFAELGMADLFDERAETELSQAKYVDAVVAAVTEEKWKKIDYPISKLSWESVAAEWVEHFKLQFLSYNKSMSVNPNAPLQNVIIVGMALNDFGFVAFDTLSGVGLNTFGFLWDGADIWTDCNICNEDITTIWSSSDPISAHETPNAPVQNIIIVGMALNDFGFVAFDTLSGLGLNTFGFLWSASDIWTDCNVCNEDITTDWDPCGDNTTYLETENYGDLLLEDNGAKLILE